VFYAARRSCREVRQSDLERNECCECSRCLVRVRRSHNRRDLIGRRMTLATSGSRTNMEACDQPINQSVNQSNFIAPKTVNKPEALNTDERTQCKDTHTINCIVLYRHRLKCSVAYTSAVAY